MQTPESISEFNEKARQLAEQALTGHAYAMDDPRRPFTPEYETIETTEVVGEELSPQTLSMLERIEKIAQKAKATPPAEDAVLGQQVLDIPIVKQASMMVKPKRTTAKQARENAERYQIEVGRNRYS
jgi:hypothetical protein